VWVPKTFWWAMNSPDKLTLWFKLGAEWVLLLHIRVKRKCNLQILVVDKKARASLHQQLRVVRYHNWVFIDTPVCFYLNHLTFKNQAENRFQIFKPIFSPAGQGWVYECLLSM
jgi:hypothetical protein